MRIAIPIVGGVISQHFGHSEQFALVDVDNQKKEILNRQTVPSPGHQPGFLPGWLAQQGVAVVIAGGMGSQAQMLFQQNNIQVITGTIGADPETLVKDFMNGTLVTGNNTCDH